MKSAVGMGSLWLLKGLCSEVTIENHMSAPRLASLTGINENYYFYIIVVPRLLLIAISNSLWNKVSNLILIKQKCSF